MISQVAGVILAGGKSSRFGSNKALALHQGATLIQTITRRLAGLFPETLLITNTPEDYGFLGWPMAADQYQNCGPLAGIHAALRTISQPRAFVCGCDMPLLNPELIRFLCELDGDHEVVLPWLPEGPEPLYAVYSKKLCRLLRSISPTISARSACCTTSCTSARSQAKKYCRFCRISPPFKTSTTSMTLPVLPPWGCEPCRSSRLPKHNG